MKHLINKKKLNRTTSHRAALEKALAISLIKYGKIETTSAKAKFLQPFIEKLITKAKESDNYTMQKLLISRLGTDESARELFSIAKLYKTRNGGYTRIVKTGTRIGDQGQTSRIEFVDYIKPGTEKVKPVAKKKVVKKVKAE